ncbi:hypothetical protein CTAYLR_008316 [Chrysophaeum taylorii]|uniref:histone acetyltransferase n=1 Tax=Chrysophaeum taylorii TaxID=2483200 RepID=A0AAD7UBK3_9STRA|nr:hypothetical protein CTAYLR_008316 [Chrysophaeum taylorii]
MEAPKIANGVVQEKRTAARQPQWYSPDLHLQERRRMITNIARLLQARKPNAPADWMQKLPQMARRLEESLFRTAESFDKYKDTQTLKKRLQSLAMAMGLRAQQQKQMSERVGAPATDAAPPQPAAQAAQQQPHAVPAGAAVAAAAHPTYAVRAANNGAQQMPPMGAAQAAAAAAAGGYPSVVANTRAPGAQRYHGGHDGATNGYTQHGIKVEAPVVAKQPSFDVAQPPPQAVSAPPPQVPAVAQQPALVVAQQPPGGAPRPPQGGAAAAAAAAAATAGATAADGLTRAQAVAVPGQPPQAGAAAAGAAGQTPQQQQQQRNYQRQHVLRQQQQRLLLLRHASKCPYENGTCTVTPLCARMKELWKHIAHCKDQQCQTPHCVSSRYVLAHYHRCKDPRCAVCGPVRAAIQRAAQRARDERRGSGGGGGGSAADAGMGDPASGMGPPRSAQNAGGAGASTAGAGARPQARPPGVRVDPKKQQQQQQQQQAAAGQRGVGTTGLAAPLQGPAAPLQGPAAPRGPMSSSSSSSAGARGLERMDDATSLLNSFSPDQIKAHLESLKTSLRLTATKIRQKVSPLLKKLTGHENAWIFMKPVDPVELNLPDYFDVIKKPMDLGTIQKRLESNSYKVISDFGDDVRLTFDNAILYNGPQSEVGMIARDMKTIFEKHYHQLIQSMDAEETHCKDNGEACVLCGGAKLLFEPPVYHCNGTTCNGVRIRRNAYYFTGGRNQYHWCQQCYDKIKDKEKLPVPDMVLHKRDLQKKKNDESPEEPWVECSRCKRWVHQICALFNGRMNKGNTPYHCPDCVMQLRAPHPPREPPAKPLGAKDIKHTGLSRFLEERVTKALTDAYAEARAAPGTPYDEAPRVYVRQVSNIDQTHQVKPGMISRYSDYPREFPARSKCVLLFQEIDGVDVILFGMYLYEYGHDCPQPNQRRVYVSYLDSVHYFRPRKYRTMVYHEMLIAYLADVKQRGFHTAHIWACPPCKGDDYIFFCHPEDQKTPKDDRLRQWYVSLLKKAKREGIVTHITNLWDEHFKADKSATLVPYFEGDYWPGEAENVLKQLEDEASGRAEPKPKKEKKASSAVLPPTKTKERGGLRSDGAPDDDDVPQDTLVARMGKILQPMKESFIVAYLCPREFAREMARRPRPSERQNQPTNNDAIVVEREEPPPGALVHADAAAAPTSELPADASDSPAAAAAAAAKAAAAAAAATTTANSTPKILEDETRDNDELIESDFYDTRQLFLNLCQGNHYQFDELRRAKHTSMMALYHMHNPEVPKFTTACSHCQQDINAGTYWTSERDQNFSLCENCFRTQKNLLPEKQPFRMASVGGEQAKEEQRPDRQRLIQLHMQLVEHTYGCKDPQCKFANCAKMKLLLNHPKTCTINAQGTAQGGGCDTCRRVWALLKIYARHRRKDHGSIPPQLRDHLRAIAQQSRQQQAQMDERRRNAMNAMYAGRQ